MLVSQKCLPLKTDIVSIKGEMKGHVSILFCISEVLSQNGEPLLCTLCGPLARVPLPPGISCGPHSVEVSKPRRGCSAGFVSFSNKASFRGASFQASVAPVSSVPSRLSAGCGLSARIRRPGSFSSTRHNLYLP